MENDWLTYDYSSPSAQHVFHAMKEYSKDYFYKQASVYTDYEGYFDEWDEEKYMAPTLPEKTKPSQVRFSAKLLKQAKYDDLWSKCTCSGSEYSMWACEKHGDNGTSTRVSKCEDMVMEAKKYD